VVDEGRVGPIQSPLANMTWSVAGCLASVRGKLTLGPKQAALLKQPGR
jgi:hypothetical protein